MKKLFLLCIIISPLFSHGQAHEEQITIEAVSAQYETLPNENAKIQWHESVHLDPSFTTKTLAENARSVLLRISTKGRDEESNGEIYNGKVSAVGILNVKGGSQNTFFNHIDASAEVEFNIEILFQEGSFSFRIFDVAIFTEKKLWNYKEGTRLELGYASLEDAFKKCVKSNARKVERKIVYETITQLQEKVDLLKVLMQQKHN